VKVRKKEDMQTSNEEEKYCCQALTYDSAASRYLRRKALASIAAKINGHILYWAESMQNIFFITILNWFGEPF